MSFNMDDETKEAIMIVIRIMAILLLMGAGVWIFRSDMEASAFNSVTGKNVTTWQAMWIELRVQEPSK
jgi:hypothetical protein